MKKKRIISIIFIIASITDFVDGYVARNYNMVTDFGKMMDAISDKLLTNSVLIILACNGKAGLIIATKDRAIEVVTIQPEGKQKMFALQYMNSNKFTLGDIIE